MTSTPAEPFCERLPKILSAAAKLLKTDFDLSADPWLPILRVADTIFQLTETLIGQIDMSNVSPSFQQRFYRRLSEVIFQICIILSEDCPTSLRTMRFLSSLIEAIENLLDCLSIDRATERTRAYTPTLWLDITEREINALRLLLPEDTPVFTCPFPLAGCNYQTTDMQQWILHRDQCYKQRSASRFAGTLEKERNELLDSRYRARRDARRVFKVGRVFALLWHEFVEAIRRMVVLKLPRLFGLCMLSVLPACTNIFGFVVCWLTILRSMNTWKCTGRPLLLI
jgi:hypothetical protein